MKSRPKEPFVVAGIVFLVVSGLALNFVLHPDLVGASSGPRLGVLLIGMTKFFPPPLDLVWFVIGMPLVLALIAYWYSSYVVSQRSAMSSQRPAMSSPLVRKKIGQIIPLRARFADEGRPRDPDVVTLTIKRPDGSTITYRWPEPGPTDGQISHTGPGTFEAFSLCSIAGVVHWRWESQGAIQTADEGSYIVQR